MKQKLPDWEISQLYAQAWQLVKKHKWLWVLGTVSGLGSLGGFRSSSNMSHFFSPSSSSPHPEKTNQVLGVSTRISTHLLQHTLASLPSWIYLALVGEVVIVLIMFFLVSLIFHSFSTAALLEGIEKARSKSQTLALTEISRKAVSCIKPFLWLQVVPPFLLFLITAAGGMILLLPLLVTPSWLKLFFGVLLFVWLLGSIGAWILMELATIWAPREIIIHETRAREAFWSGISLAKQKLWSMLLLGLVNSVLSVLVTIIPAIILIVILFFPTLLLTAALSHMPLTFLPLLLAFLLVLLVGIGILFQFVNGLLTAFKATVWTLAYHEVKGDHEH